MPMRGPGLGIEHAKLGGDPSATIHSVPHSAEKAGQAGRAQAVRTKDALGHEAFPADSSHVAGGTEALAAQSSRCR